MLVLAAAGCASPGPPRSPSLQLPHPVQDLTAARVGDTVELHFTVPTRTSDGQTLRGSVVQGTLCRQVGSAGPCTPVAADETQQALAIPDPAAGAAPVITWTDHLPEPLRTGPSRVLAYKVELHNTTGHSAGPSDAAYAAAGAPPPPVAGLAAQGVRTGIALTWSPVPGAGEVLLQRAAPTTPAQAHRPEHPHPGTSTTAYAHGSQRRGHAFAPSSSGEHHAPPGTTWLQAAPGDHSPAATIDGAPEPGVPYTYIAVRRQTVTLGGRTLELRSAPSAPVHFTWNDIYPPAAPTGLTAIGYMEPPPASSTPVPGQAPTAPGAYAVDLIWQPVEDTRLAGYRVYREDLTASTARVLLTASPVTVPAFHDATAAPTARYRYQVTAVDPRNNESPAATAIVEPAQQP